MLNDEKGLIGCVLTDPECMTQIYNRIRTEMFTNDFCQDIYGCLMTLYDNGKTITASEVSRLLEDDRRDKSEIAPFLLGCVEDVASAVEIKGYANAIESEFKTKQIQKVINNTKFEAKNIDSIIEDLQATLEGLKKTNHNDVKTLSEIAEENKDKCFKDDVDRDLIKTGFDKFDNCIGGFDKGEMIVIGARPSAGKSAFITQVICNVAEKGISVGYFNLEMGNKQIYHRVVARYSGIDLSRVQHARYFLQDEEERFNKANDKIKAFNNVTVLTGSCKLSEIKSECRHRKFGLIVIDYLQLIVPTRTFDSKAAEVGEISKQLKALAMELQVPVVALSQMNRKVRSTDEPTMSELRESGNIEQDASIIALLWNLDEQGIMKGLKVDKNRQGTNMKEVLRFEGSLMTFTETDIEVKDAQGYESTEEAEIPF